MKKLFFVVIPLLLLSAACKKNEPNNSGGGGPAYYLRITEPTDSLLVYDTVKIVWGMRVPGNVIRFEYYTDFILTEAFDTIPSKLFFFPDAYSSGTKHYIQLKAYLQSGMIYNSNIVTLQISNLLKPEIDDFQSINKSSVAIRWSDAGLFESGYRIEKKINSGQFTQLAILPPNTLQYTDTGLDSLNTYCYRIIAYNTAEEVLSDEIRVSFNISNFFRTHELHLQSTATGRIAIDPQGGKCVATRYQETPVPMINLKTGIIFMLDGHLDGSSGVDFNPDGSLVATGGYYENKVKIWNSEAGNLYKEISTDNSGIFVIRFNESGDLMAEGGVTNTAVYRVSDGSLVKEFASSGITRGLAFTQDSKRLLSAGNAEVVERWSLESGELLRTYTGHTGNIAKVIFSNDESLIYSASYEDNTIKKWQTETGQMSEFYAGTIGFSGLICLPDDKIVSSDYNGNIVVFESSGQQHQVISLQDKIIDMDYCKSQDLLICYCIDGAIWCFQRIGHWEAVY